MDKLVPKYKKMADNGFIGKDDGSIPTMEYEVRDPLTEHLALGLAGLTQEVVRRANENINQKIEDADQKIQDLFLKIPVMRITINEQPPRLLKSRASKSLPRLIANAKCGIYSLMVGPAGCGKTTAAHQVSESLGLQFGAVCLTAGASETWLFGRQTPTGFVEGAFAKIYREGGVFLADEMDAADANLLLSINTALSHDTIINPMSGEVLKKHENFIFIGAANTFGKGANHVYTGRSRLDGATLDRFVVVEVDYDRDLEGEFVSEKDVADCLWNLRYDLKRQGFDEFVSTRTFIFTERQLRSDIPIEEIIKSLSANWGDAAKKLAEQHSKDLQKKMSGKKHKYYKTEQQYKIAQRGSL